MHSLRRLLRRLRPTLLLASLVSACGGQVVEGTGAGSSGGASSSGGEASSGESPTTMSPTPTTATTAEPTTGDATTDPVVTSGGPGETSGESSGEPATDSDATGSGGEPVCGNGAVEAGELCDDGNAGQADGCTTLCRAPKNCLELLMLAPDAPNETYDIDPESDGGPLKLYCDMTGGGWTQVYYDEFNETNGWSAGEITMCGELGNVLGGAGQFGTDDSTQKQITLQNVAHTQLRLIAELAIIDSWDDEEIFAEVDGQEVAKKKCVFYNADTCGQSKNQCGGGGWQDGNTTLAGDRDHAADIAVLKFRAALNEGPENEAWGLDTAYVFVK